MKLDLQLLLATAFVLALGILIHFSVSPQNINLHLAYVLLGLLLTLGISKLDTHLLPSFSWYLFGLNLFLLAITLIIGYNTRGSTRWLDLGLFRFQTSELTKLFLILTLPQFINSSSVRNPKSLLFLVGITILPMILVFLQPDLGSTIILSLIVASIIYAAGLRYRHMLVFIFIAILVSPLLWLSLQQYQKDRISTFLNPAADPLGKGYNTIQALIAVGSGQITGRGLGHGTQSKLRFLPEHQTDFVFASLAEELGFIGSLLLVLSYVWLLWRLIVQAGHRQDQYSYLVIVGIITMFASQILINIGMNLGLLPITGITLPLVSSGGTSIIISLLAIGLVLKYSSDPHPSQGIEITARHQ